MSFELVIIFLFSTIVIVFLLIQFFFSNSNTKERLKLLIDKQEGLEKSIYELIEKKN